MRVALDGRYAEGNLTGIGKYIKNLAEGLTSRGLEIIIFYSKTPKIRFQSKDIKQVVLRNSNRYFFEQILLPKAIKQYKVDLYHATGNVGVPFFIDKPCVLTVHDIIPLEFENYFQFARIPFLSKASYAIRFRSSYLKAKRIITVSNYVKGQLIKKFSIPSKKIKVIQSGFKITKTSNYLPKGFNRHGYILNHGGIDVRKNLDRVIEAFSLIHLKHAGLKLVITGDNPTLENNLRKKVKELHLEDSIIFTGYVKEEDLNNLIKNAKLICYPSLMEGYGMPVLEGFAYGTPVITSNTTSLSEVAEGAALLVNPESVANIVGAIEDILNNKKLAVSLIKKGLKQVNKYTWDKTVDQTLNIYKSVL